MIIWDPLFLVWGISTAYDSVRCLDGFWSCSEQFYDRVCYGKPWIYWHYTLLRLRCSKELKHMPRDTCWLEQAMRGSPSQFCIWECIAWGKNKPSNCPWNAVPVCPSCLECFVTSFSLVPQESILLVEYQSTNCEVNIFVQWQILNNTGWMNEWLIVRLKVHYALQNYWYLIKGGPGLLYSDTNTGLRK